jgi:hypothetical protein
VSGAYVLGLPLIAVGFILFGVGAFALSFWRFLSQPVKIALVVAAALMLGGLAARAVAQTTQAYAKRQAKPLGAATIHGGTGWQTEGRGHSAAIASVELRQLRSAR